VRHDYEDNYLARPGIRERVATALAVFRHGLPAPQLKAPPYLWPAHRSGTAQWLMHNYESYVAEGFSMNTLIYSAIMYKVRAMRAAPLRAWTGDGEQRELLPPDHPLQALVSRPNFHQGFSEFFGQCIVYRNLSGNSFTMLDRPGAGDVLPTALFNLRPDRVRIMPERKGARSGIKGFLYVPESKSVQDGIPILPKDMMHVKSTNPGDSLEGMGFGLSAMAPLARSGDVDNAITQFLKLFFDRGAMLPGVLQFDQPMTEAHISRIKERWKEIYGGFENWTDVGVLDQGATYQRVSLGFDEMAFEGQDERNESRILGPFGVPPILIGSRIGLNRATYANAKEARQQFWQDTMVPETLDFEAEFRFYLRYENAYVAFDFSKVPALQEVAEGRKEEARQAFVAGGITRNEYRLETGRGLTEDGDVYLLPFSTVAVPVGAEVAPPAREEQPPDAEEDERDEGEKTEAKAWRQLGTETRVRYAKQVDGTAESWEAAFAGEAAKQLEIDRREVLRILQEEKADSLVRKATIGWQNILLGWQDYLTMAAERWREAFIPHVKAVIQDQEQNLGAVLGMSFDVENLWATDSFTNYTIQFSKPIMRTTNDWLTSLLQTATHEGWTTGRMENALGAMFDKWTNDDSLTEEQQEWFVERQPLYRREAIARTETIKAANYGSEELYKAWSVPAREWLAILDDRVRPDHAAMDGIVQSVGTPFKVAGYEMMYPGDGSLGAPASQIINCRCTTAPVILIDGQIAR